MYEVRDPAIKLFGRNILLPDSRTQIPAATQVAMDECREEATDSEVKDTAIQKSRKDFPSNSGDNNYQNFALENEAEGNHNPAEDQGASDSLSNKEKVLKKPDKILPCPRCHSLDTKFCYFNNYNVNQPRHFCKNCHRYWTAGGTMRNVPVGAGRRKNKHSISQYHQVGITSDGLPVTHSDNPSSINHQHLSSVELPATSRPAEGIRQVLKLGRDAPLCESMAAPINLGIPTIGVKMGTEVVAYDGEVSSSSGCSSASTVVHENELPETKAEKVGFPGHNDSLTSEHQMHYFPGPQWAYPWNQGWNAMMFGPGNNNPNVVNTPAMAIPNLLPPGTTVPFIPAPYWGCMPIWDGRNWSIPLVAANGCLSPSSYATNRCSDSNSPTLGKHSRDASLQAEEKTQQSLWVPKTLRIDDPDEAAKSSIWDTLGIKPGHVQPIKKGGIFKAFQSKPEAIHHTPVADADADRVLQANPAAFSRFQTLQENA